MMQLTSSHLFAPIIEPANYGSAGVDGDSINTGAVHMIGLALKFGAVTGNSILTLYAGATTGAKTTALAFTYRIGSADAGSATADQLGAAASVAASGLTLTAATVDHRLIVIDVDPAAIPPGKPYLTVSIDATATTLNVDCTAIAVPRYAAATMPSML